MAKKKVTSKDLEDSELLDKIAQRYQSSDLFFGRYIDDTDRWYKIWRNITTKPTNEYKSKISIPTGFWTIETTVPRIVSRPHTYTMTPRDADNDMALGYSMAAKQYFDYQLDQIDIKRKTRLLAKDAKIFGSGFWMYGWNSAESKLTLDNVPLRQLRIDPSVGDPGNIQKCRYIIYITKRTEDELLSNPNYDLKHVDFDYLNGVTSDVTDNSKSTRLAARSLSNVTKDPVEKEHLIWEHWGTVDGEKRLIVVLDKKYIIRNDKAPYDFYPFSMAVNTEDPDNILGVGDIEPVADIIEDININRRLVTDNKNIRTNVMFEQLRQAMIKDEDLLWRPGGIIKSTIQGGISPIVVPDITTGAVEQELLNYQLVEKATNTPSQIQGQLRTTTNQGLLNRTATAFAGAQQESNVRFKFQSESLDRCVEETLTNMWKILQRNVTGEQAALVIGEDESKAWVKIPEEAIKKEYVVDVKYGSAALEDTQQKREEAMSKFTSLAQAMPEAAHIFAKDLLIAFGDKHVMEIMKLIEESRKQSQEQGNLPKPPQVNLSIGGEDINSIITSEILKNYFPLSKMATTPELFQDTRMLMLGQRPEDLERDKLKVELLKIMLDAEANKVKLSNDQMKIVGDIMNNNKRNEQTGPTGEESEGPNEGPNEETGMEGTEV